MLSIGMHGACSTRVDAIADKDQCEMGALRDDGSPVLLGEPCYDDWAKHVANLRAAIDDAVEPVTGPCVALATALGEPDTWSAETDPLVRAQLACTAATTFTLPDTVTCTLEDTGGECGFTGASCEAATPDESPPWLDQLNQALPAFSMFCCDALDLADKVLTAGPTCSLGEAGVEECATKLIESSGISTYTDVVALVCEAAVPL